jgi:hypothetical protein
MRRTRRAILLLTLIPATVLLACGVALAAVITCPGGECRGTPEADEITGASGADTIYALDGNDSALGGRVDDFMRLVQVALITWLVFEVPHFVFHLGQTHHFSPGSNVAQLSGLALLILLPLVLLFLLPQRVAGRDLGQANINRTERIETR